MTLRCGLGAPSGPWEQLLLQEGFPYGRVDFSRRFDADDWSVIAVTAPPSAEEAARLRAYLEGGGALIGAAAYLEPVTGVPCRRERVRYLTGEPDGAAREILLCDIDAEAAIPREADTARTDTGSDALFAGLWRGGAVAALPFDPAAAMMDLRSARRQFHDSRDRLPWERVSRVAKGEVRLLVHAMLEYLHHARGLPYAHLWWFPGTAENVFAFRIDTDRGTPQQIDALHDLAREHELRMSWFLDVGSHEAWLHRFAAMPDQEIGVHCWRHRTTGRWEEDLANIRQALRLLEPHAGRPAGFAGPFGVWNTGLATAIDAAGFDYSSEFSFAFDGLPFFPETGGHRYRALQVPIHPVCIGSLARAGYREAEMRRYFDTVIARKLLRAEPLFFYHHPTHLRWDVLRAVFRTAQRLGVPFLSLGEYARWWRARLALDVAFAAGGGAIALAPRGGASPDPGLFGVRVARPDGTWRLSPAEEEVALAAGPWRPRNVVPPPPDLRRAREADLRFALGALFDTIANRRP